MRLTALALAFVIAAPAQAGDGRVEINQARALTGGVTPGDTAGFPVTISQSGSYVLTSGLSGMNAATSAIVVTASFVTIDLNGFAISGSTSCSGAGATLSCLPLGTGRGIDASAAGISALAVRNGTIRGMGADGVYAGPRALLHQLELIGNGAFGARVSDDAVISSCVARLNETRGFQGSGAAVVVDSVAEGNGSDGINVGRGAVVSRNTSTNNGSNGIRAFGGSLVAHNVANENALALSVGADTVGYVGNAFSAPTLGGSGNAIQVGPNFCGTDTVCP